MLKLKPLEYICHIISAIIHIAHDDVIKWKLVLRYCPFVWGIHRSPVNSPHKGQWREALMFSLICARINGWVNYDEAGDLRRPRAHYDVTVMANILISVKESVVSPPCESYFILYYTITANGISNVLCWHKYWKCEISFQELSWAVLQWATTRLKFFAGVQLQKVLKKPFSISNHQSLRADPMHLYGVYYSCLKIVLIGCKQTKTLPFS